MYQMTGISFRHIQFIRSLQYADVLGLNECSPKILRILCHIYTLTVAKITYFYTKLYV